MIIRALIVAVVVALAGCLAAAAAATPAPVHILTVTGMIEPAVAKYVERGIDRAEDERAGAVIIQLDTPGGLMDPMREMIQKMLNARVPVIVYVSPNGARAASAGAFITIAAHVAAMAPATNIGSAHPVTISPMPSSDEEPKPEQDTMTEKVVNDAAKYIVSIAERRGRNAKWAEKAVRESDNITAAEAVKMNVIDFLAEDMRELLAKADGMKVETEAGEVTLRTKGAPLEEFPMSWHLVVLHYLANPLVAFFLMLVAIYGIIFEINTPGATLPGVIGGIALVLLLYSFSVLPINAAGLLLVFVGIGLFIADIKVASHGVLSVGGAVSFFFGTLMLFGSGSPAVSVPITTLVAGTLATVVFFALLVYWGASALRSPVVTGREAIVGQIVMARTDIAPTGKVFAEGTWWTAETDGEPIKKGEMVRIVDIQGLKVKVVRQE